MYWMHNFGGGWWMLGGGILMVLFWAALTGLVIWGVIRLTRHTGSNATTKQSPFDIAKERYAKGEINKEQYEQIKKDLG
jgi:putative membrane protein